MLTTLIQWSPSGKARNVLLKLQNLVHFHAPFFTNHVYFTTYDRSSLERPPSWVAFIEGFRCIFFHWSEVMFFKNLTIYFEWPNEYECCSICDACQVSNLRHTYIRCRGTSVIPSSNFLHHRNLLTQEAPWRFTLIIDKCEVDPHGPSFFSAWDFDSLWITGPLTPH